jgi:polyphenol oxidase
MRLNNLDKFSNIGYGLSSKSGGSMNIKDELPQALANRERFLAANNLTNKVIYEPYIIHGTDIVVIDDNQPPINRFNTDGFITDQKDVVLTITVADCFPIYLHDPGKGIIGMAHAGWKGVVSGILSSLVHTTMRAYDSRPEDLYISIGPGIGKCHFMIQDNIVDQFDEYKEFVNG